MPLPVSGPWELVLYSKASPSIAQLLKTTQGSQLLSHAAVCLQLYDEMGSRHRVRPPLLNIIKTATVPDSQCKRDNTKQFHQSYDEASNKQVRVKFPLARKLVRLVPLFLHCQALPMLHT